MNKIFFKVNCFLPKKYYSTVVKNSTKWQSVVGLEVHAQIQSKSKLFSGASTDFSSPVNNNVSIFDIATPGTLPVLNKCCVEAGVLTALALNCQVNPVSYFDRKHYFYADMPAGYQITQQRAPLASNGKLDFQVYTLGVHKTPMSASVRIKQLQLEQDSGKSLHDVDKSLVDLNRAGVPLMELVFEPDLKNGEEAAALIKELVAILRSIKTCSCKMEEGALRVDANVSIHKEGEGLGTRTEIKNIGSIKGVAMAIKHEIQRQIQIRESNGRIINETRAWNAETKVTVAMRDKEVQQDYRYMPEPNLPPLHLAMGPVTHGAINVDDIKKLIPELPKETRTRLQNDYQLTLVQSIILVNDWYLLNIFEGAVKSGCTNFKLLSNFLINELYYALNKLNQESEDVKIPPEYFKDFIELIACGTINRNTAKLVLNELLQGNSSSPSKIVEEKNWKQITDEKKLTNICKEIIEENPKALKDFLKGKQKVFKFFLGAVDKKTGQLADMAKCNTILKKLLLELETKNK